MLGSVQSSRCWNLKQPFLIEQFTTQSVPTMADMNQLLSGKFNPTEMAEGPTGGIAPMPRYASGIQIGRAGTVAAETHPIALTPSEGMVHVAKHHQGDRPLTSDLLNGHG
jgi:hypothetical protein